MELLRIGCAAGFSGDRTDAASPVVDALLQAGGPAVLIFETLAERTLALAQLDRRNDPQGGYEPLLVDFLRPILARCLSGNIRIVSNFGAANPTGAARRIQVLAKELGLRAPRIAVIKGDDLSAPHHRELLRSAMGERDLPPALVSANAYIGADQIAAALKAGAEIVVAGRVSDPSLTVGPVLAHYDWELDDWNRIAGATMAGHLLECGAQVTGGYFADPGFKDVPNLAGLGFPIAEIDEDGSCIITKPANTGGLVDERTVKEQLLYEIHDPAAYVTPDVVADISQAKVRKVGDDRVSLTDVCGHAAPASLKVSICHENGWLAEGEISYAGVRAGARAKLAAETVRARLADIGRPRTDLIGVVSVFGDDAGRYIAARDGDTARDVRLRMSLRHADKQAAERLNREITALYTCGPAGGGGVRTSLRQRLGMASCVIDRADIKTSFEFVSAP